MSNQLNDLWVAYLKDQGYTGKQYSDLMRKALQDQAGSTRKQINDLWMKYLGDLGFTGSINDRMHKWLGDKGYEGSLNDRMKLALSAGDVFGFNPSTLYSDSSIGDYWDSTDSSTLTEESTGDPIEQGDTVGSFTGQLGKHTFNVGLNPYVWDENNLRNLGTGHLHGSSGFSLDLNTSSFTAFCSFSIKDAPNVADVDILFIDQQGGGMHFGGVTFEANTGKVIYAPTDNSLDNIVSTATVTDRQVHSISISYNQPDDTFSLYVDGALQGTTVSPAGVKYSSNGVYIAHGEDPDRNAEERYIWKVGFIDDALSASTLSDLHTWMIEDALVTGFTSLTEDITLALDEDTSDTSSFSGYSIYGEPLSFTIATQPTNGQAVNNNDGTYTYTPDPNYNGSDSFTFFASDGTSTSNTSSNSITVNSVVDAVSFKDTFTEASDISLASHTPDIDLNGAGWTIGAESSATVLSASDTVDVTGVTNRGVAFTSNPADYWLARVTCPSSSENMFAIVRAQDEDNYITIQWLSGGTFRALKFDNGSFTILSSATNQTRAGNDTIWWYDDGSNIRAGKFDGINWVELLDFTEPFLSGANTTGIGTANGTTTNYDNFAILPHETDQSLLGNITF